MSSKPITPSIVRAAAPSHDATETAADRLITSTEKSVATRLRNDASRRADTLADISAQIAAGTLVVRHVAAVPREPAGPSAPHVRRARPARRAEGRSA
jgi:hypothetical protein